ncbi:hypothetical protein [Cyanobium sp. Lug-B]|uniref:hypothetical protein n=1 Tax=Cyanobium sp. Lug-B TaxID=2823716 RepID=UPI0020CE4F0B|nr:hypothetical protein [Cyanobium sp. Lug-B]
MGSAIRRPAVIASRWFALVGWVLIGSALTGLLFSSLPVKLIDPAWQLRLISAILASSTFLLLGILLVCGAVFLNERNQQLLEQAGLLRRLAGWFAVLLLIIIPFQFYAGHRANGAVQAKENQSIQLIKRIIRGATAANNEEELRSFLGSLPTPPPLPARFDAPFPEIKKRLISNFDSQLNAANFQAGELRRQRLEQFIGEAVRNSVLAILMAIGFSGIAEKEGPLFGMFRRLGLFRYRD